MDRVGFLIEESGERLGCLLNPETLEISRLSGVRPRRSPGGVLSGRGLKDDAIHFTGGGVTEVKMDLLFDVGVAGSTIQTEDVRELTGPLWRLAENAVDDEGVGRLQLVRFIWGKAWNIPGVVAAIAERYENFTEQGIPQRSWVRLRYLRVENPESVSPRPAAAFAPSIPPADGANGALSPADGDASQRLRSHETVGGGTEGGEIGGERLDALAHRAYGDPGLWRWLAAFNRIDDPLRIEAGRVLQIPSMERRHDA